MTNPEWTVDPAAWIEPNGSCRVCGVHFAWHRVPCEVDDNGRGDRGDSDG